MARKDTEYFAARLVIAVFAFLIIGLSATSLAGRSWRVYSGMPTKNMGLLSIEVHGCNTLSNAASALGSAGQAISVAGRLVSAGCLAVTHEGQEGTLSWGEYQTRTCRESRSSTLCLVDSVSGSMFDVAGYCHALRKRCTDLSMAIQVNYTTLCLIILADLFVLAGGVFSMMQDCKGKCIGWNVLGCLCMISAGITYYVYGESYFLETSRACSSGESGICSRAEFGHATFLIGGAGLASCLVVFLSCVCLPPDPEYDEEGYLIDDSKEAKKDKKKKQEQAQASTAAASQEQGRAQMIADSKLMEIHMAIKQAGATDIAGAFRGFDLDGNGYITMEEFHQGIYSLNLGLTPQQIQWLMGWIDHNKDGYIAYNEFVEQMGRLEQQQQQMIMQQQMQQPMMQQPLMQPQMGGYTHPQAPGYG
eukprot:TRINITY_DN4574_c0_g2_i1.p1 TRINITY_DN4574_c0_g2~~TRINITY_DN4574_c0_g2_i1.p1  ORF type:complete len:419 (+),score=75.65 TRINITY_DN4574_c0_g2_i1:96-1352(+)